MLWRLLLLVRPYWLSVSRGIALGLVGGALSMISPMLTRLFVDAMYPARDVTLLNLLVIGGATVMISSSAVGAIRGHYSQVVTGQLTNALSLMFFNHVQHLPVRFFDQHRVGEILSRLNDVKTSLGTLTRIFETLLVNGTYLFLVPPILLLLNWRLALLSLLAVPLTSMLSGLSGRYLRQYWQKGAEAQGELNAIHVDVLSQIRTLKLAAAERSVYERIRDQSQMALRLQLHAGAVAGGVGAVNGVLRAASTAACTWYGWTLIIRGQMTLGEYLAFSAYLGFLVAPVTEVASLFTDLQRSSVALDRMFEYLDATPEADPSDAYVALAPIRTRLRGDIETRKLTFGYSSERVVLRDISLSIPAGSVTAIVGPSGAGKSSLIRLLCGLDQPSSGAILIDGTPLSEIPTRDIRRQFGVVWQEVGMLRGTIWDNLTIGAERPDRDQVEQAIRICRLESTIANLPGGLDAPVAEWGASLSGGQRQRVALARALIRNTPILMLDEATANIDVQTERDLLRDLFAFAASRTILFITHRVALASVADNVCVMNAGVVAGFGPHPHLLQSNDVYRDLHNAAGSAPDSRRLRMLVATQ